MSCILVPSAGAASSVSVIKEAVRAGHNVVATDLNEHAPGMLIAADGFVSPMCYEDGFVNHVIEECRRYGVEYAIPINDVELPIWNTSRDEFAEAGIHVLMNPSECVSNGVNKEHSYRICEGAGIRQPMRYFEGTDAWMGMEEWKRRMPPRHCFPLIVKPVAGVGGRGQVFCKEPIDVEPLIAKADKRLLLSSFLWQQYIDGTEYSVDCWGDPDTAKFVAVPRTRGKIINGQATGGTTQDDVEVVDFVRGICKAFGSNNVCCVQVIRCSKDGKLYFIEMNPRYGTGVNLSFEAGINFLGLQLRQAAERLDDITEEMLTYEVGVSMVRHWHEHYYATEEPVRCPPRKTMLQSGVLTSCPDRSAS